MVFKKRHIPWNKGKSHPAAKNLPQQFKKGQIPWNKGKKIGKQSKVSRRKKRLSQIKYVEKTKFDGMPLYSVVGKHEKNILDTLERNLGYEIFRQHKVAGYFLDGYCSALDLAIEIDEPRHRKQIQKDLERQEEIEQELSCKFIRVNINEW